MRGVTWYGGHGNVSISRCILVMFEIACRSTVLHNYGISVSSNCVKEGIQLKLDSPVP